MESDSEMWNLRSGTVESKPGATSMLNTCLEGEAGGKQLLQCKKTKRIYCLQKVNRTLEFHRAFLTFFLYSRISYKSTTTFLSN